KLLLNRAIKDNESELAEIRKRAEDAKFSAQKLSIELIENEFARRRALIELEHRQSMQNLDAQFEKAGSQSERNAIQQSRNALRASRNKKLNDVAEEETQFKFDKVFSSFDESISKAQTIARIFGEGGKEIIDAFQTALDYANAIHSLFDLGNSIISLVSTLLGAATGGIGMALPAMHDGGVLPGGGILQGSDEFPILVQGGEAILSRARVGSLASQFGSSFIPWLIGSASRVQAGKFHNGGIPARAAAGVREVPYIVSHELSGNNLKTILRRVDKSQGGRIG
ncbi:hypothetical protein D4R99_03430, partial [bacterium]